jgi:4-amino-4-deoxy-L-arabinose transferase-like glycosyltransferase
MRPHISPNLPYFPLAITLCAFALRLWRLDAVSLRGDEAFDALHSLQPISIVLYQNMFGQTYPPLYHLMLHGWLSWAGLVELSARFIAFAAGVWLVPITYRLAQTCFGETTARVAALLVALNPFLIWHAQDGRMYSLLATLSALMTLFALRVWAQGAAAPRRRGAGTKNDQLPFNPQSAIRYSLFAYILFATLNALNHYFAYLAIVSLNLVALYVGWHRRWSFPFFAKWCGANVVVGVCALLWLAPAWPHLSGHSEPWIVPVSLFDVLRRSFSAYSLGTTISWLQALPFLFVFIALTALGSWNWGWGLWKSEVIIFLCILPLLITASISRWRPVYDEKFLIFIAPLYLILVAHGIIALPLRWSVRLGGLAFIACGLTLSLLNYHFDSQFAKAPPWRELTRAILSHSHAGEVVVYNYPEPALLYQFKAQSVWREEQLVLLPKATQGDAATAKPQSTETVGVELTHLSAQVERIWFVPLTTANWDKEGAVERWLARFTDRDFELSFGALKLQRYLTPQAYRKLWTPLNADFADGIRLLAYRFESAPAMIQLTLYWQATGRITKDYTVFTHLLDATGSLRAQQDNPPVGGAYPTTTWQTDTVIVDRYAIIIPPDLPAGRYHFEVGLYDASGARLRMGNDDKVIFGEFVK